MREFPKSYDIVAAKNQLESVTPVVTTEGPSPLRNTLIAAYLDYVNNYLTSQRYAEGNGLTEQEAIEFLGLCRTVCSHPHPEALG